jgi:hypothetical protein
MPRGVEVGHGYLYDVDSNCTPQIDAMLLSAPDNHSMMMTEDGAVYAPFASALAVIEIKSSVGDVTKQLKQTAEIVSRIHRMASELRGRRTGSGSVLPRPVSVLFYASSVDAKLDEFRKWYVDASFVAPTYVVFLDRACILAQRNHLHELLDYEVPPPIDFNDHRNAASWHLCSPEPRDAYRCGRALLWLYFALLNAANQFGGNTRPASDFIRDASERFALRAVESLGSASDWPPSLSC